MKRSHTYMTVLVGLLAFGLLCAGCGREESPAPSASTPSAMPETAVVAQKLCPVMGGAIDTNVYVEHEGRRVYFCCEGCKAEFAKDPAKYLKILDEQIASGASEPSAESAAEM